MVEVRASCHPFRTRQLESLAFRLPSTGASFDWNPFLMRLRSSDCEGRGAIVGPHGSGKTTFLVELVRRLKGLGEESVLLFTNRDNGRAVPSHWSDVLRKTPEEVFVIADGYDTLGPIARWYLRRVLRPRGRLIVTAHRRCSFPTLLQTKTSPRLLSVLVNELFDPSAPIPRPTDDALQRLHKVCGGNLREVFRQLY